MCRDISRLRPAGFGGAGPPIPESVLDPGEIRHRAGRGADLVQELQAVLAHFGVVVIDLDLVEERIDRRAKFGHFAHGSGEVLAADGGAGGSSHLIDGLCEGLFLIERIQRAKAVNKEREAIESRIPDHLLYEAGWPRCVPTYREAELLAGVRREVAALSGLDAIYLDADSIVARYEQLLAEKQAK